MTQLLHDVGYLTMHSGKWHIGPNTTDGTYGIDRIAVGGNHDDTFARRRGDGETGRRRSNAPPEPTITVTIPLGDARGSRVYTEPKDQQKIDDAIRLLDYSTAVDKPFFLQIWYVNVSSRKPHHRRRAFAPAGGTPLGPYFFFDFVVTGVKMTRNQTLLGLGRTHHITCKPELIISNAWRYKSDNHCREIESR